MSGQWSNVTDLWSSRSWQLMSPEEKMYRCSSRTFFSRLNTDEKVMTDNSSLNNLFTCLFGIPYWCISHVGRKFDSAD